MIRDIVLRSSLAPHLDLDIDLYPAEQVSTNVRAHGTITLVEAAVATVL